MDWETGLVAGVTRAQLAPAADCTTRTVSRVVAWAQDAGLLVCVETGATAEFLGTTTNRAPSYVPTAPVDTVGNPPACGGSGSSPRREQGLKGSHDGRGGSPSWPVFDRATTAAEAPGPSPRSSSGSVSESTGTPCTSASVTTLGLDIRRSPERTMETTVPFNEGHEDPSPGRLGAWTTTPGGCRSRAGVGG